MAPTDRCSGTLPGSSTSARSWSRPQRIVSISLALVASFLVATAPLADQPPAGNTAIKGSGLEPKPSKKPRPPNIVLIVSDDQDWQDFGFMGSKRIQTPHLDQLASTGFVITHGFNTASTCRASLRSILTGLHPAQAEARIRALVRSGQRIASTEEVRHLETLPRELVKQGYVAFQGGKYWEGSYRDGGFTHGMAEGNSDFANDQKSMMRSAGGDSLDLGRETMQPLFEFIDEHREQPFFVWFAPMLPHVPFDASEEYRKPYVRQGLSEAAIGYYANITRLDARVGELLRHLDERQIREQTLVVFLTDNGWKVATSESHEQAVLGAPRGKFSIYEAGFRTPLIFNWPGRVEAGVNDHNLVSSVDLFPTLLKLAGADPIRHRFGVDLQPLIDRGGGFKRRRAFAELSLIRSPVGSPFPFAKRRRALFMRTTRWRYIWYPDSGRSELYEIREDPSEDQDVIAQHPKLDVRFRGELSAWSDLTRMVPDTAGARP